MQDESRFLCKRFIKLSDVMSDRGEIKRLSFIKSAPGFCPRDHQKRIEEFDQSVSLVNYMIECHTQFINGI